MLQAGKHQERTIVNVTSISRNLRSFNTQSNEAKSLSSLELIDWADDDDYNEVLICGLKNWSKILAAWVQGMPLGDIFQKKDEP